MNLNSWQAFLIISIAIWYLSHQAGRLDRLHHRIEVSVAALDGNLGRRAGIVSELANSPVVDPVTSAVLAQAAHDALAVEPHDLVERIDLETELTEVLLASLDEDDEVAEWRTDIATSQLLDDLTIACGRVHLSHTFHTDAVNDCLNIRNQWIVRFFRLAGYAELPTFLKLDTRLPSSLSN
jgi:hypothetical protein